MIKKHPLYGTWVAMRNRCSNKNNSMYKYYGARGVTVCDRWRNSFKLFCEDMGDKPTPQHSIDRKDNNGIYEPNNCIWADKTQQANNRRVRSDNTTGINGVRWYASRRKWAVYMAIDKKHTLIGYYNDIDEAISARLHAESLYL